MILSITKIELNSYSKLLSFFKFNRQIIQELNQSRCIEHKVTGEWNLKVFYTMTLWKNEKDIQEFYRQGTHLIAMKQSKLFSSKIQSKRIERDEMMDWKEVKTLFES